MLMMTHCQLKVTKKLQMNLLTIILQEKSNQVVIVALKIKSYHLNAEMIVHREEKAIVVIGVSSIRKLKN